MLAVSQTEIILLSDQTYKNVKDFLAKETFNEEESKILKYLKKFRFVDNSEHDKEDLRLSLKIAKDNYKVDIKNKYYSDLLNNIQSKWDSLYGKLC